MRTDRPLGLFNSAGKLKHHRSAASAVVLFCAAAWAMALFFSCANPGSGPDGGAFDETPPRIVSMKPPVGGRGVRPKKVEIVFDENIKVENAQEKVVVSPAQLEPPEISSSGHRITVTLNDSLKPSTTYTIDFGDAISDNNEGNPFGHFTYYFSTGAELDTMEIAGYVIDAETLSPLKGLLVGLYVDESDSAFQTRAFDRVARTDAEGRFSIKGIRAGSYKVYALKDVDGDIKFSSRAEQMAFSDELFTTSCRPDMRYDTLWRDTLTYDSIRLVHYTHYYPDDVVLRAFTHANTPRHLLKKQRDVPEWFRTYFTGPSESAPEIRGLDFDASEAFVEDRSVGNDTITYWLCDTTLLSRDTLRVLYTYYETSDSTGMDTLRTDTLDLVPRQSYAKRQKQLAEERERFEKARAKRHKRGDYSKEEMPRELFKVDVRVTTNMPPNENVAIILPQPARRFEASGVHLMLGPDSAQEEVRYIIRRFPLNHLNYTLYAEWDYGQQYTLIIDSMALESLYGAVNGRVERKFHIAKQEEFGSIFVNIPEGDERYVVQLLQDDKRVLRAARWEEGSADFFYVRPGRYFLRCFIDENGDDVWTTGDYDLRRQPERVAYYNKEVEARADWDTELTWSPESLPPTKQKPAQLNKQSAQVKRQTTHQRNLERLRQKGKSN